MARGCSPILATDRCPQIDLKPVTHVTQRVHHNRKEALLGPCGSGPPARFFCRMYVPMHMNDFLGVDCVL